MSTKSTIISTPACHIYRDYAHQHTSSKDIDGKKEVLVISVDYGFIDDCEIEDQSLIVADWECDFSKMIRLMIDKCGAEWIESMHRKPQETVKGVAVDSKSFTPLRQNGEFTGKLLEAKTVLTTETDKRVDYVIINGEKFVRESELKEGD